jgi:molybdopterin-guanine dinucleotide biosynthesis protein A
LFQWMCAPYSEAMISQIQSRKATPRVAGVVIAGGRSTRFGGEKATALLAGKPLLVWAAERLRASCEQVAVNARSGTEAEALAQAQGLAVLYDAAGDPAGPLSGVRAGLQWARVIGAAQLAVSPCDVPLLPEDVFVRLLQEANGGAALAETKDGLQPLCSVWPTTALDLLRAALAGGSHPAIWRQLDALGARRVRFEPAAAFTNVNTREDLAMIAAWLGQRT